jgi:hypothetical protein
LMPRWVGAVERRGEPFGRPRPETAFVRSQPYASIQVS